MTHIPVEVLNEIFIKLDLKDKLECMLVCQFWYNTLDRRTLLDTLVIPDHVFPKLKEMIKRQPHRANQIDDTVLASGDSPRNVIPAVSVVNLELFFIQADDLQTHIEFYHYAAKKYPSVINPVLMDIALIHHDTEYARHVYSEGIFPFYQSVGPQTDTISLLHYYNGLNAFKKFDYFGMKLKTLSLEVRCDDEDVVFIEELAQSKQAKYIQRLSVRNLVLTPMKRMLNLEALTDLRVACKYAYQDPSRFTRKTIDLNQLIAACPTTLTDLQVEGFELTFSGLTSNLPCVETLCLANVDLTPDLAKVIETSFPKLSALKIYSALRDDVSIRLPENNMKLIKIKTYYEEERQNGFSIKTMSGSNVQYYSRDHSTSRVAPVRVEEFDNPLVLNVTCASVAKLFLSITEIITFF